MKSRFPCNRSPLRDLAAYTIAEVVIAVAIVSVLFVSLYRGIAFCFDVTRAERENLRATQVILRRMEGIRLFNWNQLTNAALNPDVFYEQYAPGVAGGVTYTGNVDVAAVDFDPPASYSANMRKITVTVFWSSSSGLQTRSATTYVGRDGLQNYVYGN